MLLIVDAFNRKKSAMNKQISIVVVSFIFLMGCSGTIPQLGVNSAQLLSCPKKPNCVNSQASDQAHFIEPIEFNGTPQKAQQRMLQILKTFQQAKIIVVQDNYVRVEFTSKVFQFIDDVEFIISSSNTENSTIDFRSASRIGYSDLGANRKRMEQIRNKFNID